MIRRVQKKENNKRKVAVATGVIAVLAIGGVFAFLTAHDTVTNEFTVAEELAITVVEPAWDTTDENFDTIKSGDDYYVQTGENEWTKGTVVDGVWTPGTETVSDEPTGTAGKAGNGVPDAAEDMVPGQVIDKDPVIQNDTAIDSYAIAQVKIPTYTKADGTTVDELFTLRYNEADGVNTADWTLSNAATDIDAGKTYKTVTEGGITYHVYTYLYKDAGLDGNGTTSAIFDEVQLKNYNDGDMKSDTNTGGVNPEVTYEVVIDGFAVQKLGITPATTAQAWTVYANQHA